MPRWPGGRVAKINATTNISASGIYSKTDHFLANLENKWPLPAMQITIKAWGGGGGGGTQGCSTGRTGAAGGFVKAQFFLPPGVSFDILVAGGGRPNASSGGYGGGGSGASGGAGGGGASQIKVAGTSTYLVVAGGGGSDADYGMGGGLEGASYYAGKGGTQTAGGSAPSDGYGGGGSAGSGGSFLQGGNGMGCKGYGGGGGWYGGGGGAGDCGACTGSPSGGGSSYINTEAYGGTIIYNEQGLTSIASSDPDYASGVAAGAAIAGTGGHGRVVIINDTLGTKQVFSYTGSLQTYTT